MFPLLVCLSAQRSIFCLLLYCRIDLNYILLSFACNAEISFFPAFCYASRMWEGNGIPLQYSCLGNPMDGGAWQAAVHGVAKSRTRLSDFTFTCHSCIGEGNGNPLQCSCLENPRDGGAWRAAVYGVAQSQIRLEWLSSSSSS